MFLHRHSTLLMALALIVGFGAGGVRFGTSVLHAQICEPIWDPTVGVPGMDGPVQKLAVFDDGTGPALHAGGFFAEAGGVGANNIAKWNGTSWEPLAGGLTYPGVNPWIGSLLAADNLDPPALFVGGYFQFADDVYSPRIAQWDGEAWATVGGGCSGPVTALAIFDDGTGPAVFAGGRFTAAGGVSAPYIAKWDGSQWAALGLGMGGVTYPWVRALAVFDDGTGEALYAGGGFTEAGGIEALFVARWDGAQWSQVGDGLTGTTGGTSSGVNALAVHDDGGGGALYAAGFFKDAVGVQGNRVAKWNGVEWSPVGGGFDDPVRVLAPFDDGMGGGAALYAGGDFVNADGTPVNYIARWNGTSWMPLGSGLSGGLDPYPMGVQALCPWRTASTSALYVGGVFTVAGGSEANFVAGWSGCLGDCNGNGIADEDEFGDYDGNGDVDLLDAAGFQTCFSPSGPMQPDACCPIFDLYPAPDEDVDLDDFVEFRSVLTGPS